VPLPRQGVRAAGPLLWWSLSQISIVYLSFVPYLNIFMSRDLHIRTRLNIPILTISDSVISRDLGHDIIIPTDVVILKVLILSYLILSYRDSIT
jgi:hypothetical protein